LNTANIVLLPKKEEAIRIGDYRPISLVHSIAKIFSKILANRLAPRLPDLVSSFQSAFVKRRCIYDNFVLMQGLLKEFHRKKTSALFIKLDIAKAFDSVSRSSREARFWPEMERLDQPHPMHNSVSGKPIKHKRGLRQGDPISPMFFILAMDPLQQILHMATEKGIMHPISARARGIKMSHYVAIFVAPSKRDIKALRAILDIFGQSTGLCINVQKLEVFPIRCSRL
jgi:hypothetical protein